MYTFIGTTDERTTCDCCGRSDLKKTVVLKDVEGDFVFFGSVCGARALGWAVKDFNGAAKKADDDAKRARREREQRITFAIQRHPDVIAAAALIPMAGSGKSFAERLPFIQARIEIESRVRKEIEAAVD
jgi:hypothetical protein